MERLVDEAEQSRIAQLKQHGLNGQGGGDYSPGSFGCHEALELTSRAVDLVSSWLLEHPAIARDTKWYRLAYEAEGKLYELYQAIGGVHLDNLPPDGVDRHK